MREHKTNTKQTRTTKQNQIEPTQTKQKKTGHKPKTARSVISWSVHSHLKRIRRDDYSHHPFFSSSMADVALWLGPYMSISSKNVICTKTQKVRKCRQITTNQNHTNQPDDPQIPQPDRFVKEEQQTRHTKGARAQTKTPTKRICQGTQRSDHCVTLKNMPK